MAEPTWTSALPGTDITLCCTLNHLRGNYLAGTSITIGDASTGAARLLAQAGVSLDNDQISAYGGPGGADWASGLAYGSGGAVVSSSAIPEPSTYAVLVGGLALAGVVMARRRRA